MQQEKSKFELLREKSILAILDGDTDFGPLEINGTVSNIKVSMPYLSGPVLCVKQVWFTCILWLEWWSAKQMGLYG